MYAIREYSGEPGQWFVSEVNRAGVTTTDDRSQIMRFPTIDAARVVYRALPNIPRYMIVPAQEDRK